jgi:predicted SnoaL-like aldol condensation-catalyzing enzyme
MTDGPSDVQDRAKTEVNKAFVRAFVDDILVQGRLDRLAGYFDGDRYIQHNPHIADNLSGLAAALDAMSVRGSR